MPDGDRTHPPLRRRLSRTCVGDSGEQRVPEAETSRRANAAVTVRPSGRVADEFVFVDPANENLKLCQSLVCMSEQLDRVLSWFLALLVPGHRMSPGLELLERPLTISAGATLLPISSR